MHWEECEYLQTQSFALNRKNGDRNRWYALETHGDGGEPFESNVRI